MNYLQRKRRAFMSIVNSIKGFVKTKAGSLPLALENCVDEESLISYSLHGNSVQDGTPSPDAPVEIESVGELNNLINPNNISFSSAVTINVINENSFELVSKVYRTEKAYLQVVHDFRNIDSMLGKTFEIYAEAEKSADYMTTSIVMQWLMSSGSNTSYPIDYNESRIGTTRQFTVPATIPENAIGLRISFYIARNSLLAIGDKVTFRNVTLYEVGKKYKIPVITRGKNLLPVPYSNPSGLKRVGITFTYDDDGVCYLNDTFNQSATTAEQDFYLVGKDYNGMGKPLYLPPGNYTMSGCPMGGENNKYRIMIQTQRIDGTLRYYNDYGTGANFTLVEGEYIYTIRIRFGVNLGTVENLTFKPMLEKNPTATEYEPYVEPVTTNIYLAEPLESGEVISYPETAGLPQLPTIKGTTVYEIDTTIQPSQMDATYYSTI
jgi:hypothetical protein